MFEMPIEDIYLKAEPVRFTNEFSDEPTVDDCDEVIIEDVTEEEYPTYMSNTGETLPTFPELNTETEALLKRK